MEFVKETVIKNDETTTSQRTPGTVSDIGSIEKDSKKERREMTI
ncbi:MAG TPA: hypothetical protein VMU30_06295 [Bacteroidota bacterium]|nr:hypothetical protein [Bacteroidota bacterium]